MTRVPPVRPALRVRPLRLARAGDLLGGRYLLEDPIGHGLATTTWRAGDAQTGRPVAVKLLRRSALEDPAWWARLVGEAELTARVRHPGLVSVIGQGEGVSGPWYAMVLARTTAEGVLRRAQAVSVERAITWFVPVAHALAAVHAAGLYHGYIRSTSVLVDLADHGLLSGVSGDQSSARQSVVALVPGEAPRSASTGGADALAHAQRLDVRALASVIHCVLTGVHPSVLPVVPEAAERWRTLPVSVRAMLCETLAPPEQVAPATAAALAARLDLVAQQLAGTELLRQWRSSQTDPAEDPVLHDTLVPP
ncbi:MAG: hypothetical protein H6732_15210 [Alphaproteobacteria bacterium]|nr:hypothetical protein [Alphaproteobacteria bacterium]